MVHRNAHKKLGRVADGRIRKNWTQHPFGPPRSALSETKGFQNPNVLCWRNSMLQCLLHVPEFFHYLSRPERCTNPRCHDPRAKKDLYRCVYCALRELALHYWASTSTGFKMEKLGAFHRAMELHPGRNPGDGGNYSFLTAGQQYDPHEFFTGLTNMLEYLNDPHEIDRIETVNARGECVKGELIRNVATDRLFRMSFKSEWTCQDCGEINTRRDVANCLQLPMPPTRLDDRNLTHFIAEYFRPEVVEIACSSAQCSNVSRRRARDTVITAGPEILVIQMVRMRTDDYGRSSKVRYSVVPDHRLDLSQYTARVRGTDSNMALKYELHGIVSHRGDTLQSGHYISTVRCQNGVDFACANDSIITNLGRDAEQIFKAAETRTWQSYVLVYQKVGGKMAKCI